MKKHKSNRETEWCVIRVGTRGAKSKVTPLMSLYMATLTRLLPAITPRWGWWLVRETSMYCSQRGELFSVLRFALLVGHGLSIRDCLLTFIYRLCVELTAVTKRTLDTGSAAGDWHRHLDLPVGLVCLLLLLLPHSVQPTFCLFSSPLYSKINQI